MVDVSVCIVTLNARDYLRACLESLAQNIRGRHYEVVVVDNCSSDGTLEMLQNEFPHVQCIHNQKNEGFTLPINQAMRAAQGRFVMLLNPDTLVLENTVELLAAFMEAHPEAGICGPKVLNNDGTLQKACRRGVSRPWAAFSYFVGLSNLFPQSKLFGGYLLNYLPEDETHEVDGVSGSCMMIRREVIDQVGYFDERYFAYQEDADYCFQVKKAGWKVYYFPSAQIVHYGGMGGSKAQPYRSILEWHRSYFLYYRKNLAQDYFFVFNWFYYSLMLVKLALSLGTNALRKEKFAGPRRG